MSPHILANPDSRLKRGVKRCVMLAVILLLAVATWLWLTMLSPWFYQRPSDLPAVANGTHQVFVYGTLRYAPIRYLVMGTSGSPETASLGGYRRCGLNIAPVKAAPIKTVPDKSASAPDTVINGLVLEVSAVELARLDRYERLGVRYTRRQITLQDSRRAWVYRRLASNAPAREPVGCPGSDTIDSSR